MNVNRREILGFSSLQSRRQRKYCVSEYFEHVNVHECRMLHVKKAVFVKLIKSIMYVNSKVGNPIFILFFLHLTFIAVFLVDGNALFAIARGSAVIVKDRKRFKTTILENFKFQKSI